MILNPTTIEEIAEIPITKGFVAIVDAIDADLAGFKWHAATSGRSVYANRAVTDHSTKRGQRTEKMHRVILERILGRALLRTDIADHKDGDGLNNRRSNIRLATVQTNKFNIRGCYRNNRVGVQGVNPVSQAPGRFQARIQVTGKQIYLGIFSSTEEAHAAYRAASLEHFGEFSPFFESEETR